MVSGLWDDRGECFLHRDELIAYFEWWSNQGDARVLMTNEAGEEVEINMTRQQRDGIAIAARLLARFTKEAERAERASGSTVDRNEGV